MESIDPATGRVIAHYAETPWEQIEEILCSANNAFMQWRSFHVNERSAPLNRAAEVLRNNKEQYAALMAQEMGKPLVQGAAEIEKCAGAFTFYAQQAAHFLADVPIATEASQSFVRYEPLGTVFAIMPWNFPFWQVVRAAAPALMSGNAVVLKHAPNVCGCARALVEVFEQAGFLPGLFNCIFCSNEAAAKVIEHPLIQAVTLTGSTRAGKSVAACAGAVLKKTVLELGGSDPYIVLEDADVPYSAGVCARSRLMNSGQSCIAAKRFIVAEPIFDRFMEHFISLFEQQRMGPPLEEGVTMGPLARRDLRDQLDAQVHQSLEQGARLTLGGVVPQGKGAFYPPTILENVRPGMPAYDEELFGPVAVMFKAANEQEAIDLANDTVYGLGSAVFSSDVCRALRLANRLQAGSCFVNESVHSDVRLPFGGIRHSGYGRELSWPGIHEFVNIKTVYVK